MTSSTDVRRGAWRAAPAMALALLAACGGDGPVRPPTEAPCDGVDRPVVALERFETHVLAGEDVHCTVLAGAGARYLVMPQLIGETLPYGGYGFRIGDPDATPTAMMSDGALLDGAPIEGGPIDAQARLDALLRARERTAPVEHRRGAALRTTATRANALDPQRRFSVLSTLDATPAWSPVDAQLRFEGERVAIYLDTLAAASLSAAELLSMGQLYDEALAPRIFAAFGAGSDIDDNGKVILLLTPQVNALVTPTACAASGFVRGFFYGHDLASAAPTSNQGEVFYAYVPDPAGQWSCAHTKSEVLANLPPTFIHELQHMVSYGAHVIARGGANEEVWLNEGLSHVAEELGSLYWEAMYPPPTGRTDPTQLFPDSAAPYINPNLLYSFRFLVSSGAYSLTGCAPGSFCSQSERGGTWLFLRWLADQKGETALRDLVQTAHTGRTNLEAAAGESISALLADFAVAVSTDSLEGVARTAVAARYRFASRNLRAIYRKLFEAYGVAGGVTRPFPIVPLTLGVGTARTGTMRPGTFIAYRLTTGDDEPTARLRFSVPDGSAFGGVSGARVSIVRID